MMSQSRINLAGIKNPYLVGGLLILLAALSRFIPHPANFSPFIALAVYFGITFRNRRAFAIGGPLLALLLSDTIFGFYPGWPVTYAAFAMISLASIYLKPVGGTKKYLAWPLAGSVWFFIISNLGVWCFSDLYPQTLQGLYDCYVSALPFFQNTMTSSVIYAALLFGGEQLVRHSGLQAVPISLGALNK